MRIYKDKRVKEFDLEKTFVSIDSPEFKKPEVVSLKKIGDKLRIGSGEKNIKSPISIEFASNQKNNPDIPPGSGKIIENAKIAIDENYLYIWIPQLKKWKRALLSSWDILDDVS